MDHPFLSLAARETVDHHGLNARKVARRDGPFVFHDHDTLHHYIAEVDRLTRLAYPDFLIEEVK